ncbi:MAG TPA: response regulator [Thermoanaerobaculia bacterium]|nr:response regulator [Thermoanaerobaculia bacterium]
MANGGKKRLLVVDDEKPIRQLLARIGQRAGFEVHTARDGVEALEMLQKLEYAITIVDLMMPRLSGYELLQKISTLDPRPVVLVATALANSDVASLDDSMVRRVIRKPFDIQAVANALIETAAQIAEQQERADKGVALAPPEVVKLPVAPPSGTEEEKLPRSGAEEEETPAEPGDEVPPDEQR